MGGAPPPPSCPSSSLYVTTGCRDPPSMWVTVMGLRYKCNKKACNCNAGSCLIQSLLISMTQRACLDAVCHVWCVLLHLPGRLIGKRTAECCNMQQLRSNPNDWVSGQPTVIVAMKGGDPYVAYIPMVVARSPYLRTTLVATTSSGSPPHTPRCSMRSQYAWKSPCRWVHKQTVP
jgi:hypothetical protein